MAPPTIEDRFDPVLARQVIELSNRDAGLGKYLGIELLRMAPGQVWCRVDLGEHLVTISGNVHGGALAGVMDHITGAAIFPLMPEGHWGATTELKLNYIAPVAAGSMDATATVLAMTNRSAVVRAEAHCGDRLVCAAQGTISIVAPRIAAA